MITCGFVGLGLIGGSIARALKANRKDIVIIACDPNEETLKLATEQKIADEAYPAPCDAFTACDYIFLCAPVSHNDENLLKILSYRKKDCILTDVGSVKTPINSLIHSLGLTDCFIGGHPMAGRERGGFTAATDSLYVGASMILTQGKRTDMQLLETLKAFFLDIGFASLTFSDPEEHDRIIAFTSQMAHVISNAYIKSPTARKRKGFSAGSYRDLTRVAWLNPPMWDP